jgi:hypothetical protein
MPVWLGILLVAAICCLFCWYLSPDRVASPSLMQRIVAKTWIVIRRIISFSGAAFCILVIYVLWTSMDYSFVYKLLASLGILMTSFFFVYVGIVGQGWVQYDFRDDLSLYKKIKEKYNLRW